MNTHTEVKVKVKGEVVNEVKRGHEAQTMSRGTSGWLVTGKEEGQVIGKVRKGKEYFFLRARMAAR